jgi:hybrid cluster-associated redox disulfide protein
MEKTPQIFRAIGMTQPTIKEITKGTTIAEVLEYPGALEVLTKYRLPCLHCPMAALEIGKLRIGEVAYSYGIDADELIKELNQVIKSRKSGSQV